MLLVLASTHYDGEEYIRDYGAYVEELESAAEQKSGGRNPQQGQVGK